MKKLLILIPIILTLLLAACTPQIVLDGGTVVRSDASPTADIEQAYRREEIVYVTKTGTKYHEAGCSHLSKSQTPISLEQAEQQEYLPCSVCHPTK